MLKLRWNLGGTEPWRKHSRSRKPPPEYEDFLREKRLEFVQLVVGGALGAASIVTALAAAQGDGAAAAAASFSAAAQGIVFGLILSAVLG